ncbi:hypothetical protein SM139_4153 [Stenotrophomonas maltophilia]|nr:hypothetical protein SM139_4153 [Stenotrophomonas maltophilia]
MSIVRMTDLDLSGKRVLIRQDLNVPIENGRITSEQRITASLPTLKRALEQGAAVMVTSHLGARRKVRGAKPIRWRRWPSACPSCSVARFRWCATGSTASRSSRASWCCWKTAA